MRYQKFSFTRSATLSHQRSWLTSPSWHRSGTENSAGRPVPIYLSACGDLSAGTFMAAARLLAAGILFEGGRQMSAEAYRHLAPGPQGRQIFFKDGQRVLKDAEEIFSACRVERLGPKRSYQ